MIVMMKAVTRTSLKSVCLASMIPRAILRTMVKMSTLITNHKIMIIRAPRRPMAPIIFPI